MKTLLSSHFSGKCNQSLKSIVFLDLIAKLTNELCPKTNQFTSILDYLSVENFKSFCRAVWSENQHDRIFKVIHPL